MSEKEEDHIICFIKMIKMVERVNISRGTIIDLLNAESHKDLWKYTMKALIIGGDKYLIAKSYILEKLDYCKQHLNKPYGFLSISRYNIYKELCYNTNI